MLSPKTLDAYRRMTPGERLRLTLELSRSAWSAMLCGDPKIVDRRFQRLAEENDFRNRQIVQGLRRAERLADEPGATDRAGVQETDR